MHSISRTRLIRPLAALALVALAAGACSKDKDDKGGLKDDTAPTTGQTRLPQDAAAKLKMVVPGKLTVCTDTSSVPYGFEEAGKVDGLAPELVRGLAGRFALNAEFVPVAGKDALSALDAGKCDVAAAAVAVTEDARKNHLFSEPYLLVYPSLLVRSADVQKYKDLAGLKGRTVGVQAGTTSAAYAKKVGAGATIKEFAETGELFAALEGGRIDAVVHDLPVTAYRASTTGAKTTVARIFTDADKKFYALAMAKDRADLKKVVDDALLQVKSDDTYPTVLRRFLGDFAGQALKDVGGP